MIVINTVDAQRFSLNGIEYFKNFTPVVAGDTIKIVNTYGNCIDLLASTNYINFTVDGNNYLNVFDLQNALLPVLYSRDSLGVVSGSNISIENTSVSGAYNIDWNESSNWELVLIGNTTISESNLPLIGTEKTITIYIIGDFSLSLPAEWVVSGGGVYDGLNGSQIVVQARTNATTKYQTVINPVS